MLWFLKSFALKKLQKDMDKAKLEYKANIRVLEWQLESANDKLMHARVSQRYAEESQRRIANQYVVALRMADELQNKLDKILKDKEEKDDTK